METNYIEPIVNMLTDLGIDGGHKSLVLGQLSATDNRFARDLKLNVATVLRSSNINPKEANLLALGVVANEKHSVLIRAFENKCRELNATEAEIAEVYACMTVMSTNNVFYRFKHYMEDVDFYNNQPAGLRMNVMMNPVLGKDFFELLSLAISAVNGCERCVRAHEHSVKEHGSSEARIYDAIRLASVIKGLCQVI